MLYTLQILSCFPVVLIILYLLLNFIAKGKKAVCVVVLGDIGRSPRMQYHAVSLAQEGFTVDIVGYGGSTPIKQIVDNNDINIYYLKEPPNFLKALPRIVSYFVKVIWQSASLGFTLLLLPKSGYIFLQNPPAIPTIAVSWVVSLLRCSRLVVDWHNYGYTILALSLRKSHPLVIFSRWYEKFFGRFSRANLCVTKAMREDLKNNWGIRAMTLYDRPPERFQQTPLDAKHKLFSRLGQEYPVFAAQSPDSSVFTRMDDKSGVVERSTRPALLVSSTSWTEDEDFGILLSALQKYEEASSEKCSTLPDLICVITGKGPQKEFYKKKISETSLSHIQFCLPWLTAEDYPLLLGSADIGVCLHKSSSGLDLPMKVVDMFGCGIPVCAVHFDCLSELVQHGENGLVFQDSQELSGQLQDLLKGFPGEQSELTRMRSNIKSFQAMRWHSQWKELALPLFGVKAKED